MSWRQNLLPASLDGVPFHYTEARTEAGRRGQLHEFAGRDDPFAEDLGRAARVYNLRAFLIGEDYALVREAMLAVIESDGEHTLTHPYLGDFQVRILGRITLTERDNQGRYCEFDLTLTESGFAFELVAVPSIPRIKALKVEAVDKLSAKTRFDLVGAIAAVLGSLANGVGAAASAVRKVNGKISAALNLVDNITAAIDDLQSEIGTLLNSPTALMNKLGALVDAALGLITGFLPQAPGSGVRLDDPDLVRTALETVRELFSFSSEASVIPTPTAQSQIEHNAHDQLTASIKAMAVASGAAALVDLPLASARQAQSIGGELADMFEEVLSSPLDEEVTEAFAQLKALTVEHFTEQAIQLPQVARFTPRSTVPALVIAHDLYGDPDLEEDIIRRNGIRHPAFVLGGRRLEVLAGG